MPQQVMKPLQTYQSHIPQLCPLAGILSVNVAGRSPVTELEKDAHDQRMLDQQSYNAEESSRSHSETISHKCFHKLIVNVTRFNLRGGTKSHKVSIRE